MEQILSTDSNILINKENDCTLKEDEIISDYNGFEDMIIDKNPYMKLDDNMGFKNDIYESSNIISKLFFYWGYKVLEK